MKVNDLVVVANLGEMRVYKANPRDLEAEAGLNEDHIKLDLINDVDFINAHKRLQDLVTDQAGRFKADAGKMGASIAQENNLEQEIEEELIKTVAEDISDIIKNENPPKYFLALPKTIYKRVLEKLENSAKEKLFKLIKEDLVKTDKNKLIELFKEKGELF